MDHCAVLDKVVTLTFSPDIVQLKLKVKGHCLSFDC